MDVSDAFLQGVDLHGANLMRGDFSGADMREADLRGAMLGSANMHWTNLIHATLSGAEVSGADFSNADLEDTDLSGLANWQSIAAISGASIQGVRNPPAGFIEWAKAHGAIEETPRRAPSTSTTPASVR